MRIQMFNLLYVSGLVFQGKEYVLVVNSDNAAAVVDPSILMVAVQFVYLHCINICCFSLL